MLTKIDHPTTTKKIAFIRKGLVPIASQHVAHVLGQSFPDAEIKTVDVTNLLASHKEILLANLIVTLRYYGLQIFGGKKKLKEAFFRTPYIFHQIKGLLQQQLAGQPYLFTFQMQSLFDASQKDIPHFIYTDHTNLANLYYTGLSRNKLYANAWLELERAIYNNATLIFTRSHHITQSLVEQYRRPAGQVVCVYAGSNTPVQAASSGPEDYGSKHILFVGIDWERKGGPVLVEAFKKVLQVYPDARLTIVGCTPQVDLPNCQVIGRVPVTEVSQYYRQASIFCLPTRLEPFGIAFIEALNHKLPVVATDVGAIPDFVTSGHNGYLVKPDQVEPLAQALIDLVGNPDKCRLFGERGYRIAMDRYTWDSVGARMKEAITATIGQVSRYSNLPGRYQSDVG